MLLQRQLSQTRKEIKVQALVYDDKSLMCYEQAK
jgi:hypothetical protein